MPVTNHKDSVGPYFQYGKQKKYRYISGNAKSREIAKAKAQAQGRAIKVSQTKCNCKH